MFVRNTSRYHGMVSSLRRESPLATNARVMNGILSGYTADTEVYEYRGENFLDSDAQGTLFRPASSSSISDSDQLSLQGIGSQQNSLPQNFYRACSQRSSLTSSQGLGVGVSAIFLCQGQSIDWFLAQEHASGLLRQPLRGSVSQLLPAQWGNSSVCLLSCVMI